MIREIQIHERELWDATVKDFENYDVFATLANYVIRNSTNRNIQESAYYLLDGCAKYRYSAENYLREINIYYPMLGN